MSDQPTRQEVAIRTKRYEQAILARLEAKAEHTYQWPRWPAAYEASIAAVEVADTELAALEQECRDRECTEQDVRARLADAEKALADLRNNIEALAVRLDEDPAPAEDVPWRTIDYREGWEAAETKAAQSLRNLLVLDGQPGTEGAVRLSVLLHAIDRLDAIPGGER